MLFDAVFCRCVSDSLGFSGTLNTVIARFIAEKDPGLECRLVR